jgi:hypothetical protein
MPENEAACCHDLAERLLAEKEAFWTMVICNNFYASCLNAFGAVNSSQTQQKL